VFTNPPADTVLQLNDFAYVVTVSAAHVSEMRTQGLGAYGGTKGEMRPHVEAFKPEKVLRPSSTNILTNIRSSLVAKIRERRFSSPEDAASTPRFTTRPKNVATTSFPGEVYNNISPTDIWDDSSPKYSDESTSLKESMSTLLPTIQDDEDEMSESEKADAISGSKSPMFFHAPPVERFTNGELSSNSTRMQPFRNSQIKDPPVFMTSNVLATSFQDDKDDLGIDSELLDSFDMDTITDLGGNQMRLSAVVPHNVIQSSSLYTPMPNFSAHVETKMVHIEKTKKKYLPGPSNKSKPAFKVGAGASRAKADKLKPKQSAKEKAPVKEAPFQSGDLPEKYKAIHHTSAEVVRSQFFEKRSAQATTSESPRTSLDLHISVESLAPNTSEAASAQGTGSHVKEASDSNSGVAGAQNARSEEDTLELLAHMLQPIVEEMALMRCNLSQEIQDMRRELDQVRKSQRH